ncbi:ImmA/IrrE family metallo-endopeptidase [Bacillus pumilus]|uniref:ImmA/IrrE family metallo-endopeptidase n=1 Tax=Bacillus pumilus TaxID=1408 RepID=UPI00273F8505|nr:ImmA/IrrE family metallo-endopeptidase [Bacillus pumilus]WLP59860.1 ImmA/IrrE family metallo-endopeptidase [Bacillus pumilus]
MKYIYTHLEDNVNRLYAEMKILNPSEQSIDTISEKLGIEVCYKEISSRAIINQSTQIIILDKRLNKCIRWEKFCHEIGHILFHSGNQLLMPDSFRLYQEWKSNSFMYHFAVPTFMLRSVNIPVEPNQAIQFIAKIFKVTPSFAKHRLNLYYQKKFAQMRYVVNG